jgi:carboxymethylenebutenolidase
MTLSFAAANDTVRAAVSYYGPTPQPASVMSATKAAILAQYGADDARVNQGIPDLEAALAGKTFEKRVYDGAGHAFNNDTGPAYNEAVAVEAWTATTDWLRKYLT